MSSAPVMTRRGDHDQADGGEHEDAAPADQLDSPGGAQGRPAIRASGLCRQLALMPAPLPSSWVSCAASACATLRCSKRTSARRITS